MRKLLVLLLLPIAFFIWTVGWCLVMIDEKQNNIKKGKVNKK